MEILHNVAGFLGQAALFVVSILLLMVFWTALGLLATVIAGVVKLVSGGPAERRDTTTTAAAATIDQPPYSLALLIRFDERSGEFRPSVQVRGEGALTRAWIRLELVDEKGTLRLVRRRRLARTAIGTELSLPAFEPPEDVSAEEVLGWNWDVVIEDKQGERARWREHPARAGYLNAEAELA